jgi:nucleosome binding factor SPN SPT16 subunit
MTDLPTSPSCRDIEKKYKTREKEEKEKADLVEQDNLVIASGKGIPNQLTSGAFICRLKS